MKKKRAFIILLIISILILNLEETPLLAAGSEIISGDVNNDGFLNATDFELINNYFLGKMHSDYIDKVNADFDEDCKINILDVCKIKSELTTKYIRDYDPLWFDELKPTVYFGIDGIMESDWYEELDSNGEDFLAWHQMDTYYNERNLNKLQQLNKIEGITRQSLKDTVFKIPQNGSSEGGSVENYVAGTVVFAYPAIYGDLDYLEYNDFLYTELDKTEIQIRGVPYFVYRVHTFVFAYSGTGSIVLKDNLTTVDKTYDSNFDYPVYCGIDGILDSDYPTPWEFQEQFTCFHPLECYNESMLEGLQQLIRIPNASKEELESAELSISEAPYGEGGPIENYCMGVIIFAYPKKFGKLYSFTSYDLFTYTDFNTCEIIIRGVPYYVSRIEGLSASYNIPMDKFVFK